MVGLIINKLLLMLLSWTMILLGSVSFVSCGDDDDDDNNKTSVPTNASEAFSKYGSTKGAKADGDNVVWVYNEEETNTTMIMILHYNGANIESGISYAKFESEDAAKAYYEAAKADGSDASIDGNYVTIKSSNDDLKEYEGLDKNSLVAFFNAMEAYGF